jgi:tetratricopeptide (TPR) repeat protein
MARKDSEAEHISEVEAALLDAELFVKYRSFERAVKALKTALEHNPRSLQLRERLREICASQKQVEEAARQCLALASIYIEREDFDTAHDRLLEAKQFDSRINIAAGLDAIRRARRPDLKAVPTATEAHFEERSFTLAGDMSVISVFDAIQVIENARLSGILSMKNETRSAKIFFNFGSIVDAQTEKEIGEKAFQLLVEITGGTFEFHKTEDQYPVKIQASSNTNLILDTLRRLDEAKLQ